MKSPPEHPSLQDQGGSSERPCPLSRGKHPRHCSEALQAHPQQQLWAAAAWGGGRKVSCPELFLPEPVEVWGELGLLHPAPCWHLRAGGGGGGQEGPRWPSSSPPACPLTSALASLTRGVGGPQDNDTFHGTHWAAGAPLQRG